MPSTISESIRSIYSAVAFLVSRLASPESGGVSLMNGTFGLKCVGSFARLDPDGCWLKTSRDSSASVQMTLFSVHGGSLEMFSGTWPRWGIVSDGVAMELEMLEPHTSETGFSSWATLSAADSVGSHGGGQGRSLRTGIHNPKMWPTPNVPNGGRRVPDQAEWTDGFIAHMPDGKKVQVDLNNAVRRVGTWPMPQSRDFRSGDAPDSPRQQRKAEQGWSINLNDAVKKWPTPTSNASTGAGTQGRDGGMNLQTAVKMWPTPVTRDWKSAAASEATLNRNSRPLNEIVRAHMENWPTPSAADNKARGDANSAAIQRRKAAGKQIELSMSVPGQLNPAWVEALQGFPPGWTEVDGQRARRKTNTSGNPQESREAFRTESND